MKTQLTRLDLQTTGDTDLLNITGNVIKCVRESGVSAGLVCVSVPGTTASVTTIEWQPGLLTDFRRFVQRVAPDVLHYDHNLTPASNGHSHLRASMLGPSITLPISFGEPALGARQQVMLCDFDNAPRTRSVLIQVIGN